MQTTGLSLSAHGGLSMVPDFPDPVLRQPLTLTAILPLYLSHYIMAVLAILPNTFILKLSLLPFIIWQAWTCTIGLSVSMGLARLLGLQCGDRLVVWDSSFVLSMFFMVLRSFELAFIKRPLRRYELLKDQEGRVERPLSVSNILLDAVDLFCNQRGIGWSLLSNPFPRESIPPPSIALVWAKMLLKLTALDASQYIIQRLFPSVNSPGGGSLFDPTLSLLPRTALAALCAICGGVWMYAFVDSLYHIATLIGRIILRQPASQWPRLFHRPWMATSIQEFWGFRWHQLFRHFFIVFGARPGGALLGKPGAVMGAFTISAIMHHISLWGFRRGTEFSSIGGFFLLMGLGAIMEGTFKQATGLRVQGWIGWSWTMLWTLVWGTFFLDGWARRGIFASDFFPDRLRPGKMLIDTIVSVEKIM